MKASLKTVYKEVMPPKDSIMVNLDTGEQVLPEIKVEERIVGKDEFYLTYTFLINALQQDMTIAEVKVFAYLLENYGSGIFISINKTIKEQICKKTGLNNTNTVSNVIYSLQKKKIPMLVKQGRGTFILNPRYAFQGSSKNRDKELKAIINLGCKNC
jgi:hypothetical protein